LVGGYMDSVIWGCQWTGSEGYEGNVCDYGLYTSWNLQCHDQYSVPFVGTICMT
jgi:hypothetical protein